MAYMGDPPDRAEDQVRTRHPSPSGPARCVLLAQSCGGLAAGWLAWRLAGSPLAALVAGLALPILIHGAVQAVGFLIAWLAAEAPRGAASRWIGTWLREWPRSMQVIYQCLAWREGFPTPAPAAGSGGRGHPVVLIHCFAGNRGLWSVSAPWFASRGHPLVIPSFTPADGDIEAHVEPLRAAIARAADLADDPDAPVHLVGHSMGGLIARAYLRRYGWDGIGGVVTLGTPHCGTPLAWFGMGRASRQMRPLSPWLKRLAGEEPLPPPRQLFTVISQQDNITTTAARQTVPLARHIRLSGLGHMSYVFEPRIIDLVLRLLAGVERRWRDEAAQAGRPHPGRLTSELDHRDWLAGTGIYGDGAGGGGPGEPSWVDPEADALQGDEFQWIEPWLDEDDGPGNEESVPPSGDAGRGPPSEHDEGESPSTGEEGNPEGNPPPDEISEPPPPPDPRS